MDSGLVQCQKCEWEWIQPAKPLKKCPGCGDKNYLEPESGLDGGTCDLCGCKFITPLLQAHYCPNCGSKKWDDGKPQPKFRPPNLWVMAKAKKTKKGTQTYKYWMATWREGRATRNVHIGSCAKMDMQTAREKARVMKTKALGVEI
jgi:hypothetical protein